eukprot:8073619-Pyramimonas_sp.AAC.1
MPPLYHGRVAGPWGVLTVSAFPSHPSREARPSRLAPPERAGGHGAIHHARCLRKRSFAARVSKFLVLDTRLKKPPALARPRGNFLSLMLSW